MEAKLVNPEPLIVVTLSESEAATLYQLSNWGFEVVASLTASKFIDIPSHKLDALFNAFYDVLDDLPFNKCAEKQEVEDNE